MGDRFSKIDLDGLERRASDEQAPARRRGAVVPSIPPADASPHDVPARATKHLQDRGLPVSSVDGPHCGAKFSFLFAGSRRCRVGLPCAVDI